MRRLFMADETARLAAANEGKCMRCGEYLTREARDAGEVLCFECYMVECAEREEGET